MKLCCKHRQLAQLSPQQAELMWRKLTELGDKKIVEGQWVSATSMLGSAFETAEILLNLGEPGSRDSDLERYIQTLKVFVLCLRNSDYQVDYESLCRLVCERLRTEHQREAFNIDIDLLIKQVSTIFSIHESSTEYWKPDSAYEPTERPPAFHFLH